MYQSDINFTFLSELKVNAINSHKFRLLFTKKKNNNKFRLCN
jgi:hypothetical protein